MVERTTVTRRTYLKGAATLGAVGLAGCMGGGGDGDDGTTVSMSATAGASFGQLVTDVIQGEEFDLANGIELDVTQAGPADVPQLVINESVDVGFGSPEGMAEARLQGNEVSIFGPWNANHSSLLTRSGTDYEGFDDLRGETLGILSPPSGIYFHTTMLMNEYGWDLEEEFETREGAPPALREFIVNGDVEAGMLFYPLIVPGMVEGELVELEFMPELLEEALGFAPDFVNLIGRDEWIDDDLDRAANLQQTMVDVHEYIQDNPVETLEAYGEPITIETEEQIEVMAEKLPNIVTGWDTNDALERIPEQIELAKEQGLIDEDAPSDIVRDL